MTVLHIMQCTNLGGMEHVACMLMRELDRQRGMGFRITTPRPFGLAQPQVQAIDPEARDFPYIGRFGWRTHGPFARHVRQLSEGTSTIWVTGTCVASLKAARGALKQPKIMSHHYHHFEGSGSWLKWRAFYEFFCRDLELITYPTRFTRDEALRIAPWLEEKAVVVRNGLEVAYKNEAQRVRDQKKARKKLGLPNDAWIVGNAGWLIQRKRFDVFLRTAALLAKRLPESYFVICGGGDLEQELKQLAKELGLADRVRFTGWVHDITPYYQAWDAMLFNSDFDTIPRAPLEAAAQGCVVLSSLTYGGLAEFIDHETNGILLADHDEPRLAEALFQLAKDERQAREFRKLASLKLRTEYAVDRDISFFHDVLSGRQGSTDSAKADGNTSPGTS